MTPMNPSNDGIEEGRGRGYIASDGARATLSNLRPIKVAMPTQTQGSDRAHQLQRRTGHVISCHA